MQHITIDQSGKIEDTSSDTIIAMHSSQIQYAIKITKKNKQEIFSSCRKCHKKILTIRLFSYCLSRLLENRSADSTILIDNEYPGHEKDIRRYLKAKVIFGNIGKKDPAHKIAYDTFSGKTKPNKIIDIKLNTLYSKRRKY